MCWQGPQGLIQGIRQAVLQAELSDHQTRLLAQASHKLHTSPKNKSFVPCPQWRSRGTPAGQRLKSINHAEGQGLS